MPEQKTIGQLMEEMRLKAGAREYSGHSYMDLNRFAEDTRHMIIFDTLTADSPVGWKGNAAAPFSPRRDIKVPGTPGTGAYQDCEPCEGPKRKPAL